MELDRFYYMTYGQLVDYCKENGLDTESAETWSEDRLMVWARSH